MTMIPPAIPLPAPPSKSALKPDPTTKPIPATSSSTTNLINLEATAEQVAGPATTTTTTTNT